MTKMGLNTPKTGTTSNRAKSLGLPCVTLESFLINLEIPGAIPNDQYVRNAFPFLPTVIMPTT
ncbi:hypothetical protein LJC60_09565, partial [Ruminococcaceae bacterium OttesenSCG-928-D13]|nr:hypothetical protein [Ruminococcaceae bacterium OttesenSCG-928-D13]